MPNKEQVEDGFANGNIPNRIYGSDHVRIEAAFKVFVEWYTNYYINNKKLKLK